MMLLGGLGALLGGGAAAAPVVGAGIAGANTVLGAAGAGISMASILQGGLTALGVLATVGSGLAEADQLEAQAIDAEMEQATENLQGIDRRASIKREMMDALGAQDVAYAASGVDLSFGTARQARTDAYREADLALSTQAATQSTRITRLAERAQNYRRAAKSAKLFGFLNGAAKGIGGYLDWKDAG